MTSTGGTTTIGDSSSDNPTLPWNTVHHTDCMQLLCQIEDAAIDLVYIDPPYFTNRTFIGRARASNGDGGLAAPDEPSPDSVSQLTFSDRWQGGRSAYLHWLRERIVGIHRVLKGEGVFLLHLDWHVVHYAKVLCDQIFGDEAMQNELIWYYQTGGASKDRFSRKHNTILCYAKGEGGGGDYFDGKAIAIPRTAKAMKRAQCLTGARIKVTDTHKNPDDVLTVPALNPMSNERTGYPTQKPLQLLETLIVALCPPGGTVGDFFCGSGTTLVAAKKLRRRYVGCDVSADAVALTRRRLEGIE